MREEYVSFRAQYRAKILIFSVYLHLLTAFTESTYIILMEILWQTKKN